MSTYIDPSTAIRIARQARAEQIRQAEQYHQARTARGHGDPGGSPPPRRRWHFAWRHPGFAQRRQTAQVPCPPSSRASGVRDRTSTPVNEAQQPRHEDAETSQVPEQSESQVEHFVR
jgi:hypothetical protein